MTTDKMILSLKRNGWVITFCNRKFTYTAIRGFIVFRSKSITNLYKKIKTNENTLPNKNRQRTFRQG